MDLRSVHRGPRPFFIRTTAGVSIALAASLALGFGTPVFADDLEDRKSALESEISEVQQSIEYLDEDITETIAQLKVYQGQLPAAQQALADAQGRVESAANEVSALAMRVQLAEETRTKIADQLAKDKAAIEDTRKVIGQIATQSYKNGGVPSDVALMLGADGAETLTDSMDMVDQALRGQNAAMDRLSQQSATNANSQARLTAVEAEIKDLKSKAEAALQAEQSARDAAATEKAKVDTLIADTSALSAKLQKQKPVIEAQLASVEEAHEKVTADIAERQRRLIEEARKAEEARLKAEAEERARVETERRVAAAAEAARVENERRAAEQRAEDERRAAEAAAAEAALAQGGEARPDPADRPTLDLTGEIRVLEHHGRDHVGHGFWARIAELLALQVLHRLDPIVAFLGDPDLVGDARDAGVHDGELDALLGRGDHGRQCDLAVGQLGGEGVAHGRAAAGRGQEARDVKARLLEPALLLGDRVGHAVHAGSEMGDVQLDGAGLGDGREREGGGEGYASHVVPP